MISPTFSFQPGNIFCLPFNRTYIFKSWHYLLSPFLLVLFFALLELNAQEAPDSRMYKHSNSFWNSKEVILVRGRYAGNFGKDLLNKYESWAQGNQIPIKDEDDISDLDLKKHLFFMGPIKSYNNLSRFCPKALKILKNGFTLGPYNFTDSLDAISLYTSDSLRCFQLGNSYNGLISLWTTLSNISQYLILRNFAVTHHGFLDGEQFSAQNHYDVIKERQSKLKKVSTSNYDFYYDESLFSDVKADSLFKSEDTKIERAIRLLELKPPKRKIECYMYKDIAQKYYCSATPGWGNPFILAWQNHSVGIGAVEHESIHILFNNQYRPFMTTFYSEGIVGYYYSIIDSLGWKKTRALLSRDLAFPIKTLIMDFHSLGFSDMTYAASAYFSRFLIDTFGLDKFKELVTYDDIEAGFNKTYKKSLDEIIEIWKSYLEKTKIVLGPERKITFKVIVKDLPDSSNIFIAGDHSRLGSWDPGKVKFEKQADSIWVKTLCFNEGTNLSYKITRGSWDSEALDQNGNLPDNSSYEVKGDDTIIINVKSWKDLRQ